MPTPTEFAKRIVEEGFRNAVVRLSGSLTNGDINVSPAIQRSDFLNNDLAIGNLIGFRVDHVTWSVGDQLEFQLAWQGNTPEQIIGISRTGKIDVTDDGGFLPNSQNSGYTGDINLSSLGHIPGATQLYVITLRLVKLYD